MIRRRLQKRTVIVHLLVPGGRSLRGILDGVYRDCIVLKHPHSLDDKADLEGELVIPRNRVDFYQTVEVPNG